MSKNRDTASNSRRKPSGQQSEHVESLELEAKPGQPSSKEMAAEIEELRKKLRKSERINEIKKTVGYFAEEK